MPSLYRGPRIVIDDLDGAQLHRRLRHAARMFALFLVAPWGVVSLVARIFTTMSNAAAQLVPSAGTSVLDSRYRYQPKMTSAG